MIYIYIYIDAHQNSHFKMIIQWITERARSIITPYWMDQELLNTSARFFWRFTLENEHVYNLQNHSFQKRNEPPFLCSSRSKVFTLSTAGDARATFVAPWHGDDGRCQRHALLWSGDDVRLCIRCRAGSSWGKPEAVAKRRGCLAFFFLVGPNNQESLLMPQKYWIPRTDGFLLLGLFHDFFSRF